MGYRWGDVSWKWDITKKALEIQGFWWEQRESNPRPSACKADALNQLSYAPEMGLQIYGHFLNLQIILQEIDIFLFTFFIWVCIMVRKSYICTRFNGDVLVLTASDIG